MENCKVVDNFMPSEIARLVLGYLKVTNCTESWRTLLSESPHLREYKLLYKEGKEYPTSVGGKNLMEILQSYYVSASKGSEIEMQDAAQQTDESAISRTESFGTTLPSSLVSTTISQTNFKQVNNTNINHENEQPLSNQLDQLKKKCSVLHVTERTLLHSNCIASSCTTNTTTTTVTPMDICESNNCSNYIVSCNSPCQSINISTENIHKHLAASCCPSTVYIQPCQSRGMSSGNCSQTAHVTQCHQQGLGPQIGINTYSNHSCQFSTTATSQIISRPVGTCANKQGTTSSKNLPNSALHNKNGTVVTSIEVPQTVNVIPKNVVSLVTTEHIRGVSRLNSEKSDNSENSSSTPVSPLLYSNGSCNVNTTTLPLSNTVDINRTIEYSPYTFLSQQRLLPSLNTPMKELCDLEEYFCSPKRKSMLPRRRLLSSFSPAQISAPGTHITEDVELLNEEPTDCSMLMEEFFKRPPLLEKIAENINNRVSTEQNQMALSAKQITDSDLSFSAQVSCNHDAMIKDIVTRTESDPVFEDLIRSLCERVDSSKDGFENTNIHGERLENNKEATHCSVPNLVEEIAIRKENVNSVNKTAAQSDSIITSSAVISSSAVIMQENTSKNNVESSQLKSPTASVRKVTENSTNIPSTENGNEKTPTNHVENITSTNPNSVVQNEKLIVTQNVPPVTLVTDLSQNIIQTITIPTNNIVLSTSSTSLNSNTVSDIRQPVTIATPSFQFLTLSPRHLYGIETSASLAAKTVPGRVKPIQCKPLVSSDATAVARNSFIDKGSYKPVNRIPKDMVKRGPHRHMKPNILKSTGAQSQVTVTSNDTSSILSSSQNNSLPNSNSSVKNMGMPNHDSSGSIETHNSNTKSKVPAAEKTSPRLKSLVTSAQTLAGNAFLNRTHKRALDFGVITNASNQTSNINPTKINTTNQLEILPNTLEGSTQNGNQVTLAIDNLLEGLNNSEIVIYLDPPEVVTSEGTVTIPLNNESGSVPAYLSFTPCTLSENNASLVAQTNIIVTPSSTQDIVVQNQSIPLQETANNDSEIAETLVKLASSIPDSENTNKNVDSANKEPVVTSINKKLKRPPRKCALRPKRRKLEDFLRQGMDIDKFLSRLNYEN